MRGSGCPETTDRSRSTGTFCWSNVVAAGTGRNTVGRNRNGSLGRTLAPETARESSYRAAEPLGRNGARTSARERSRKRIKPRPNGVFPVETVGNGLESCWAHRRERAQSACGWTRKCPIWPFPDESVPNRRKETAETAFPLGRKEPKPRFRHAERRNVRFRTNPWERTCVRRGSASRRSVSLAPL